ncbi:hypothetical protein B0T20DRAFT_497796 [Sordaria brevicollis]|uniref:Fucose-specific lectin n=1 Tax=Sordaria brevicollis TaxID=83679 RepID=A0AAE0PH97_SORBR|nr:hypothetical protein B0T20DRAFT_497796 [Sordaria brevicollis]
MAHNHQIPPPGEGYYGPDHTVDHQYHQPPTTTPTTPQPTDSPQPGLEPHPNINDHQPGLEPTHFHPTTHADGSPGRWAEGLEVVPTEQLKHTQHWPEVRQEEVGKELSPTTALVEQWKWKDGRDEYNAGQAPEVVDGPVLVSGKPVGKRRKRLWIILGVVLAVMIVVGAVVGGVVGAKAARESKGGTAPVLDAGDGNGNGGGEAGVVPSPSKTTSGGGAVATSVAPVAGAIKAGSPLTVTGWRNDQGSVGLYLFYQDKQNDVYYVKYDGSSWGKPVATIKGLKRDTKVTATIILNGLGNLKKPHIILTYIGPGPTLLATTINENNLPSIANDEQFSKDMGVLDALDNSSVASYFPATVYQTPSGELGQARVIMLRWFAKLTGIMALPGTSLTLVPISSRWANYSASGGYGIIYQEPNGKLAAAVPNLGPDGRVEARAEWFNSSVFPDITPPSNTPFSAWVTARSDSRGHSPNTYILYRSDSGDINMLSTSFSSSTDDSAVTWKTSSPDGLKGMDKDTDIGCVMMASIDKDNDGNEIPVEEDSEEVDRCFFMKGGKLVEARMSGKDGGGEWRVVGDVPLPS